MAVRITSSPAAGTPGGILDLLRGAPEGLTRADLMDVTGLARSTVAQRLDSLTQLGLVTECPTTTTTRGRPATRFAFSPSAGVLLIADCGATGVRAAVTDLQGWVLAEVRGDLDIAAGPDECLVRIHGHFRDLVKRTSTSATSVYGIGVACLATRCEAVGRVVAPPIMPGWDQFDIPAWFSTRWDVPVIVENDANAMAVGEHRLAHSSTDSLFMIKIATGIGAGIITDGHLYRGADGAAGDIGHLQTKTSDDGGYLRCRCGNEGCLEAYASGWALVRDLQSQGRVVRATADVVDLVRSGDVVAVAAVRRAGRVIGASLADAVSLLNPSTVVIGGTLAAAEEHLFAGIRESVYARSLPLATRRLAIVPASQGSHAGVAGLVITLTDRLLDPVRIDGLISSAGEVSASA